MANLNLAQVMGRLTVKPELKTTPNGTQLCHFGVATNFTWKDKAGEKKQQVEFHNIVVFGKPAEVIAKWFEKGDEIYIQGRIQTRTCDDANGIKRNRTEILAEKFDFGQKVKRDQAPEQAPEQEIAIEDIPF